MIYEAFIVHIQGHAKLFPEWEILREVLFNDIFSLDEQNYKIIINIKRVYSSYTGQHKIIQILYSLYPILALGIF